ncbi:hypothetical protein M408DRAFT_80396 [Serendipita vermifera MAFF 305830]|uniref:ditrans,polycis-polyprenyl diphosphate synthase [(2E,6E)-farnesyldiphosphate specific] n=1 Tax=Serendipita vermifera MAFF 305830 TaxID=933852 RepID=A0A0C3ANC7_SERVB|nr:hypothetical protein M408DRAFT_80396 [Serendipita vermifera MAFF 305830]
MLQYALLWLFHLFLALKRFVSTLLPRRQPRPLGTKRRKLPGHLAVLLSHDKFPGKTKNELPEALESVRRLALWCRIAGIRVLSVYDDEGLLLNSWERVHDVLQELNAVVTVSVSGDKIVTESRINAPQLRAPLTPPLSKSGSLASFRSSSPDYQDYQKPTSLRHGNEILPLVATFTITGSRVDESKKRQPVISSEPATSPGTLTIHILSRNSGKPHFSNVTREIAKSTMQEHAADRSITPVTPELLTSLKAPLSPLEFEGFPPWQMDLTEITYIPPQIPQTEFLRQFWTLPKQFPGSISERAFRAALDEYDGAEMRFGK